ncbi:MAG: GNAT family N-acetyltransferase [Planctomycetota bacterium]|nr:GNAT family N-acetyltransferase [Planctomycetota bacterium]
MSFEIRRLVPEDAPAYVALRREMLADAPLSFASSVESDRGVNEDGVRLSLTRRAPEVYAIVGAFERGERLVAAAGLTREERPKRRHVAGIWGVYVTPACRGRGLAREVVGRAIEIARGWGVSKVQLSVSETAPAALRVYERLGFVAWGRESDALRVDGTGAAEIHMDLRLER